ncbi:MAG: C40 family peptidase [Actinomycetota bacterium]|nr:C40 family peptidase [Actinomycetota bacterium]
MRSPVRVIASLAVTGMLLAAPSALAQTGGSVAPVGVPATLLGPPGKAKLKKNGVAVAPANAPIQVQMAINAGNAIRTYPYRYGGGHRSFVDSGYDCSGAVSYVLNGAGLLADPVPSGSLASSWGAFGKGRWITVYAHGGHAYMVVAGLRFDTSAVGEKLNQGSGPRWRKTKRSPKGYAQKYYPTL